MFNVISNYCCTKSNVCVSLQAALEYAIQHDLLIKISCPFVTRYVKKYEPHFLKYIL